MSSFRKRNVHKPISGTRTSPQTGQVITSSGNPSMDLILGGGLPIGSVILIEEDKYGTHSKVLAKYFLAEGVVSQQSIFLGSLDDDPIEILKKLPKPLNEDEIEKESVGNNNSGEQICDDGAGGDKNGLRIAWRYNDLLPVNSEQSTTKIGHHFNLMEHMNALCGENVELAVWDGSQNTVNDNTDNNVISPSEESKDFPTGPQKTNPPASPPENKVFHCGKYYRILDELSNVISQDKFNPEVSSQKSLCRICVTSLASPLWYEENFDRDILKFLTILRSAVRNSVSVCFITMPMHLIAKCDESLVSKIRNLVDFAIELESFAGSDRERNSAFKEYNGLLHLRKVSAINTLSTFMPETLDLAFKLRRKKFIIEKLHLPPELQESEKNGAENTPTLSCGENTSANASLDF